MSFDWTEYLRLARFLETASGEGFSQEAALRCAVSRAYYSAFCYARNYASFHEGFLPQKHHEDHGNLRKHFTGVKKIKIADILDRLRQWRNSCDYEDTVTNLSLLFNQAVSQAAEVLKGLKAHPAP